MNFTYQVRDPLGNVHDDESDATSEDQAHQLLRADGFQVLELEESAGGSGLFAKRVKKGELIYATSQLGIMVETGINISTALAGLAEQEENPTLRAVLSELRQRVEAGDDLSKAMADHPKVFDATFIALIRASEQTGSMGAMLEQIAGYLRAEMETRGKIKSSMAYPAVMMVLAVVITLFLLTCILPKFTPLFSRKGMDLPLPTVVLMAMSKSILSYWYFWIAGAIAAFTSLFFAWRTTTGQVVVDWIKINVPVIGPLVRKVIISRSIRTLGSMLSAGVSMLDAIELTSAVCGNHFYSIAWNHVLDEITQGKRIAESLRGNAMFPTTLVQMIDSGEETGKLDYVLQKVSAYYDKEVDQSLKTVTSIIEPVMITVMGGVVGGIGFAIMLPIFQLSQGAH